MKIILPILVIALISSACASYINQIDENSKSVRLHFFIKDAMDDTQFVALEQQCEHLGEVIGSQGHWYDYLFLSNKLMTQGALNDIRNEAHQIGANKVVIHKNMMFITSVTMMGQAYNCKAIATK